MVIGASLGYGTSFFLEVGVALPIAVGVLIGSSVGITMNIHRDDDYDIPPDEDLPV
ncbi:hypothetical protein [Gracilimonas sp.]|uniref:hypothetical protein n=1 Tax=Gracilimonas sp. TaxID=1974203 RepID=UPI003BA946DA